MYYLAWGDVNWINNMLRPLAASLDYLVYSLLGLITEGMFNIANLTANAAFLQIIYKRVYLILSIFMVFKLTFSFLQYLVNPDAMSDKERGVGKVIARTITMVCLLILLPIIFFESDILGPGKGTILNVLQKGAIETLPRLILGYGGNISYGEASTAGTSDSQKIGEELALQMLKSFYYPIECKTITADNKSSCDLIEGSNNLGDMDQFEASVISPDGKNTSQYHFYYQFPLTTIAGILMIVIMLGITIDVAIRCFKLIILQMMAPIPIMTYIDPKSSKDGGFSSWLKTFITTYIDVFIKLGSVYLVILLVSRLWAKDLFNFSDYTAGAQRYMMIFLMFGLFKFAKDAPKFIKDAMGIKDNGGGGGFMGKALAGMAGAAAGFAGGVAAGGGLSGALSGAMSGASAGAQNAGSGKPLHAYSQIRDEQAKQLGKTPGGIKGKLQQRGMQKGINRKTGLNAQTLAAAKSNMYGAATDESLAQDKYNRFLEGQLSGGELSDLAKANGLDYDAVSGAFMDKNGKFVDEDTANSMIRGSLYDDLASKQTAAAKAKSNYDKANKIADSIGLTDGFMDENRKRNKFYRAIRDKIGETSYDSSKGTGVRGKYDSFKENTRGFKSVQQKSDRDVSKGGFDPNKRA